MDNSYLILKNNMIIIRNNLEYINTKFIKYIQYGGNEIYKNKLIKNMTNISNMQIIKKEINNFNEMTDKVKKDLDILINKINEIQKKTQSNLPVNKINDINTVNIKNLIKIGNDDLFYDEKFNLQNFMLIYHGLIQKSNSFLKIKNYDEFNDKMIGELRETYNNMIIMTKSIDSYNNYIEKILIKNKMFTENFIFSRKEAVEQIKKYNTTNIPIDYKRKIIYHTKSGNLVPINLKSIVDLGYKILGGITINDKVNYLSLKYDGQSNDVKSSALDIKVRKNIFMMGGNITILNELNRLIRSINNCNYSLQKLNDTRDSLINIISINNNFTDYLLSIININPPNIYIYIDKKIIDEYLIKISKIAINNNNKLLLEILNKNFSIISSVISDKIIDIDMVDNEKMKIFFMIFNNYLKELDK
jgi:hypothetical protein